MKIEAILARKSSDLYTVRPETPVTEAARLLHTHKIGAVVVTDEAGDLLGIFSERDLIRAVGNEGRCALHLRVDDLMTRSVESCTPEETCTDVAFTMNRRRIRHLPVLEDGRLIGMISVRDVMGACLEEQSAEVDHLLTAARQRTRPAWEIYRAA